MYAFWRVCMACFLVRCAQRLSALLPSVSVSHYSCGSNLSVADAQRMPLLPTAGVEELLAIRALFGLTNFSPVLYREAHYLGKHSGTWQPQRLRGRPVSEAASRARMASRCSALSWACCRARYSSSNSCMKTARPKVPCLSQSSIP